jgi:hypothetical protein
MNRIIWENCHDSFVRASAFEKVSFFDGAIATSGTTVKLNVESTRERCPIESEKHLVATARVQGDREKLGKVNARLVCIKSTICIN